MPLDHSLGEPRTSSFWRGFTIVSLLSIHACSLALRVVPYLLMRRGELGRLCGCSLARACEALGPTFIKLGQILSARPDLLPAGIVGSLIRLQEQVQPFDSRLVQPILEQAFGRRMNEIFLSFDPKPVASASIAHVHRARLADGRDVAVKIRRPGITAVVESDLRILGFLAGIMARLPGLRATPLPELVRDVSEPIREQLNFRLEAANNRHFQEHFRGAEGITIPALIEDLCTENVLTMEYLDRLERVDTHTLSPQEREAAALSGLRALYKMIFIDGLVHADMHPGNVFVRAWGEIVILDLGLVARLSAIDQRDFVDFFFGLVNNQGLECARIICDNASYRGKQWDQAAFEAAIVELIGRHSALKADAFQVSTFVYQLMETQRRFSLRGSTKFMMTILSLVVFDGICKQLHPNCQFQNEARPFLIAARYRRRTPAGRDPLPFETPGHSPSPALGSRLLQTKAS